ncbi:MAG: SDR family oxidoreductase, partial [Leptospiraceae bacterium]|nr:SDR family oxidoreductase [Leptospiraceae bacterium]
LTAYAKSKVNAEKDLEKISDDNFIVTCLRFATACGMSPRLRLDLVLNDFVTSALVNKEINILSDGKPWRPLIHVKDMSRAINWAIKRELKNGGKFIAVNTGSNNWNYQVSDLAEATGEIIKGISIKINKDAQPDKRSYKVNFDYFNSLAPEFQPQISLKDAISDLLNGLESNNFNNKDFRNSEYIRLNKLNNLKQMGYLDLNLNWKR